MDRRKCQNEKIQKKTLIKMTKIVSRVNKPAKKNGGGSRVESAKPTHLRSRIQTDFGFCLKLPATHLAPAQPKLAQCNQNHAFTFKEVFTISKSKPIKRESNNARR
jgi:hypothetical protein